MTSFMGFIRRASKYGVHKALRCLLPADNIASTQKEEDVRSHWRHLRNLAPGGVTSHLVTSQGAIRVNPGDKWNLWSQQLCATRAGGIYKLILIAYARNTNCLKIWTGNCKATICISVTLSWIPWNLSFRYILFHEKCLQTMLWHHNARVNSHQRWKQTRFRVCFHLWCELTSTMNVTQWLDRSVSFHTSR